jgi:CRISPR-associated endonuclease Csn1
MASGMRYRLALDLGSTSLGWAMLRLNADNQPCAIIKAGVRIFPNGREPAPEGKQGESLAKVRREKRQARRRRDRLLKRKARMMRTLIQYGFFPEDADERKALEGLNPFALRAKGLDAALTPAEFARVLFHINQRRGFKSNRKTDKGVSDSGALKTAINKLREDMKTADCLTVGKFLFQRHTKGESVRARNNGMQGKKLQYDLYIDRAMIEQEFDALWAKQAALNPALFSEAARADLKDVLLYQRKLKPVQAGRCTFLPDEERAPLALPSTQRFRMYQEVNNLRLLGEGLKEVPLTLQQRDQLIAALEKSNKMTFKGIKKLLGTGDTMKFNLEDPKREDMKGNSTSAILGGAKCFGAAWFTWSERQQDAIVKQLVSQENLTRLVKRLQKYCGIDERRAEDIADKILPPGYGSLSAKALALILPELRREVITYDKAAKAAGFHHSQFENGAIEGRTFAVERVLTETGKIKTIHLHHELPYYGEFLQRHVGFGTGDTKDTPEKRYGKIANPTVHIGLNQVRCVVNALIKRYGHPSEIIVELARDLKQSKAQREEDNKRQAENQKRNQDHRKEIAEILEMSEERVAWADIEKMILWNELHPKNAMDRHCPYSGVQISKRMLLTNEVEIEHILPFSRTLDDSRNNKTVSMRQANRIKGNRTPWEARHDFEAQGWHYPSILARAENMAKNKRYRFGEDGLEKWLDGKDFAARALNDTRHLSKVALEYLKLICPRTHVIPGKMTSQLAYHFGLYRILHPEGRNNKNRNDHRHHAVDACVIGITDRSLVQHFADASASFNPIIQQFENESERQKSEHQQHSRYMKGRVTQFLNVPWGTFAGQEYFNSVQRAIAAIWVSHKPDHGYEGAMHNDTAYGLRGEGQVSFHKMVEGQRTHIIDNLKVIPMTHSHPRHGILANGEPKPYKGYKGDSNYCIEIVRNEKGKWEGEVISTFEAYQLVRQYKNPKDGVARLRHPTLSVSGKALVMRLVIDDYVRFEVGEVQRTFRVASINSAGTLTLAEHQEANVDARNRDKNGSWRYTYKVASSLQKAKGRKITISPIGELRDSKFKG